MNLTHEQKQECQQIFNEMQKYLAQQIYNRMTIYGQTFEQAIKEEFELE